MKKKGRKRKMTSPLGAFTFLIVVVALLVGTIFILHDNYGFFPENSSTQTAQTE